MGLNKQPLVSVVTPFHNTEDYLAECIESVLDQTYDNWEYVLVNNWSSDRSLEVAQSYAKREPRIRLYNNDRFLSQVQNYNHALRQISHESKYCKIVQSDDWIFPECLQRMVEVAEKNGSVGIVGAYQLEGTRVGCVGLPYPSFRVSGRDACRAYFIDRRSLFGTPTSLLFRTELIRSRNPFYNEDSLLEDIEVCFDLLQESDYGFVHQILTFTRTHDGSMTSGIRSYNPYLLHRFILLRKYGRIYLTAEEYNKYYSSTREEYFLFLGESLMRRREKAFWDYHRTGLRAIGCVLGRHLPIYAFKAMVELVLNPKSSFERLLRHYKRKKNVYLCPEVESMRSTS